MKKINILIILATSISLDIAASNDSINISSNDSIPSWREQITHLDTTLSSLNNKPKQKTDTLMAIVNLYRKIDSTQVAIIEEKNRLINQYVPYKDWLFLLSDTTSSVFEKNNAEDIEVPTALKYHFETIKMIISAHEQIVSIENKIKLVEDEYNNSLWAPKLANIDINTAISSAIEDDMDNLTTLLDAILQRDLSSLTSTQYEYFKPGLTEKYNDFIKYFE